MKLKVSSMWLIILMIAVVTICSLNQISNTKRFREKVDHAIERFIIFLETGDIDLLSQITAGGLKYSIDALDIDPLKIPEIVVVESGTSYHETSNKKILIAVLQLKMNVSFDSGEVLEISKGFNLSMVRTGNDAKICYISMQN